MALEGEDGHEEEVAEHEEAAPEEHASAEHGGGHGGGGHGGETAPAIEFNPLPDEVVKRQNGVPAAGYDLREPEKSLLRELASATGSDIEVRVGIYFVDLDMIYSNARVGNKSEGALVVRVALEMSDAPTRNEVAGRKEEFRGLVNSVLFEFQKHKLLTYEGKMDLKKKIQTEINHKLKKGRVVDVLLADFHMRP